MAWGSPTVDCQTIDMHESGELSIFLGLINFLMEIPDTLTLPRFLLIKFL